MPITPNNPADYTPSRTDIDNKPARGDYTDLQPFRFWCQRVLPLVYDDSLSYYELLCKVVDYLNKTMEDVQTLESDVTNMFSAYEGLEEYVNTEFTKLTNAYNQLQSYVNNYFSSLDVQQEINNKLDDMVTTGELHDLFINDVTAQVKTETDKIPSIVTSWLNSHVTPGSGVVDTSLSIAGAAADAKTVGDKALLFKGSPTNLNYTSLGECMAQGVYSFTTAQATDLSDLPESWNASGGTFVSLQYSNNASMGILYNNTRLYVGYLQNNRVINWTDLTNVETETFKFRGNSNELNYTNITDFNEIGCYRIVRSSVQSISGIPSGFDTGFLVNFKSVANDIWSLLIGTKKIILGYKINNGEYNWINIPNYDTTLLNRGTPTNDMTSIKNFTEAGYYTFTTADSTNISDMPEDYQSSGGALIVLPRNNSQYYRILFNANQLFINLEINDNMFWKNCTEPSFLELGMLSDKNITSLVNANEFGAYRFLTAWSTNMTDLPTNYNPSGGSIVNFGSGANFFRILGNTSQFYYGMQHSNGRFICFELSNQNKIRIKHYEQQIQSDSATEYFDIFVPTHNNFSVYRFAHCVNTSKQANVWRLAYIYLANDSYTVGANITRIGEFEFGSFVNGSTSTDNQVGGIIHGHEIDETIVFKIDGVTISDISNLDTQYLPAKEFRVIRTSNLYNNNTVFAKHFVEYIFTENGCQIGQSIKFITNTNLQLNFIMFPIRKNYSNFVYFCNDFEQIDLSNTSLPITKPAENITTYYSDNTLSNIEVIEYNVKGTTPNILITDNGGLDYNKYYYGPENSPTLQFNAGDIISCKFKISINC